MKSAQIITIRVDGQCTQEPAVAADDCTEAAGCPPMCCSCQSPKGGEVEYGLRICKTTSFLYMERQACSLDPADCVLEVDEECL